MENKAVSRRRRTETDPQATIKLSEGITPPDDILKGYLIGHDVNIKETNSEFLVSARTKFQLCDGKE